MENNAKVIYYGCLSVFAAAGTAVAEWLGGWDAALQTLIALMVIDYVTGIICALVWKKSPKSEDGAFESKASLKGLMRKMCYIFCVYIATRLDMLTGAGNVVRTATILFFCANDGFSILENLGLMGVPFPDALKNAFEVLKKKSDTESDATK